MSALPVYSSLLCSHLFPFQGNRGEKPFDLPREVVEKRNREIEKVDWVKKEYLTFSAVSILTIGRFVSHIVFGTTGIGVGVFLLLTAVIPVIAAIWKRSEFFQKKEELKKEMDPYPRNFLFQDCSPTKTLCTPAETESIRPYLDPDAIFREGLNVQVRSTHEYTLEGGEETLCGWAPLTLEEQFVSDEEEEIRQEYRRSVKLIQIYL